MIGGALGQYLKIQSRVPLNPLTKPITQPTAEEPITSQKNGCVCIAQVISDCRSGCYTFSFGETVGEHDSHYCEHHPTSLHHLGEPLLRGALPVIRPHAIDMLESVEIERLRIGPSWQSRATDASWAQIQIRTLPKRTALCVRHNAKIQSAQSKRRRGCAVFGR